jgi:uncharacterized membrane protein
VLDALLASATGAGEGPGARAWLDALAQTAGRAHPLLVHFPIALLIVAACVELVRAARRDAVPSRTAGACLLVGAFGAALAAGAGWLNADFEHGGGGDTLIESHRWVGLAAAVAAAGALPCGWWWRRSAGSAGAGAYRALVVLSAMLVGVAGHLGGTIVYGGSYLTAPIAALTRAEPEPTPAANPPTTTDAPGVDFAAEVWPIFDAVCIDCHGEVRKRGQLRLDSRAAVLKGGKSGPAVIPGDPDNSELIRRVLGLGDKPQMPEDGDPLTEEQVGALRRWIRAGAPWPGSDDGRADLSTEESHWAYQPVGDVAIPVVTDAAWVRTPVDAFILARLESQGIRPAGAAAPGELLRRLTLDLTGLPPAPGEVAAFEADPSESAYAAAVDRLLASPRHAEHEARGWLDLARYADSMGYEKDNTWSAWPYRDWVIRAFALGMPYDQFTIEQIAGDMVEGATREQVVATGFSRCSMINEEGGVDPEEYRVNAVVDRTNTVAEVWLGTTLACAQCHDHKYDPFTREDFYRLFAFFNNTPVETQDLGSGETKVISPELRLTHPLEERWKAELAAIEESLAAGPPTASAADRAKDLAVLIERGAPTPVMRELTPRRPTHILERGSFLAPGRAVEPGTPRVLPSMDGLTPDRLGLARWLVRGDNPLTARVTANRVWSRLFGRGLVETEEDFGTRGAPPSHPDLLDWLSREFMASGWDLRRLQRVIVMSSAYRQSSVVSAEMRERDPANVLVARGARFRLEAEVIRDQALSLAGLLSGRVGGPSVYPPQPEGIWGHAYSGEKWKPSEGEDRYRRGLYTFWKRATPYPSFVAFDAPQRQITCTRRPRTNTPLQALTTLNDPVFFEAAVGLARRILAEGGGTDIDRAAYGFRLCTARTPEHAEVERLVDLLGQQRARFSADPALAVRAVGAYKRDTDGDPVELASWAIVANVLLNLDEVLNKG